MVVKPTRSVIWTTSRMRQQIAQVVGDVPALEAAIVAVGGPLTLQEYVSGTDIVSCAGVRIDDRLLGLTFVRYGQTYPSQVGSAALAKTIAPPRQLTRQIEELLGLIGWYSIFELELLEFGENRFGAIDFNPRPFGWMALAVGEGANLPALWCDHILRQRSVSTDRSRVGIHYRWEDGAVRHALMKLRHARVRSTAAVLRPHRRVVHAHFRIDDPAPLVARMLTMARKAGRAVYS
jgi:predicted ATP-grasp superfamily ATP-dependent carboligase